MSSCARCLRRFHRPNVTRSSSIGTADVGKTDGALTRIVGCHSGRGALLLVSRYSSRTFLTSDLPDYSLLRRLASTRASSNKTSLKDDEDHYRTLGVPREATDKQIKTAFIQLSKIYHPDVNKAESAVNDFLKIRSAYEVLNDVSKKKEYDKTLPREEEAVYEDEEEEAPRPRRPKKRSNQEDDEEVDFETRRWRPQFVDDAEREYMQFYAKDAPNMSTKRLQMLVSYLKFKAFWLQIYRRHPTFWYFFCLLFAWRMYSSWRHYFIHETISIDEEKSEKTLEQWLQAEMSRRLHWKENLDRLPEVMEEERRIEREKILERYNRLNSE